ncbi:MAG: hypothetical protein IKX43_01705, partial [Paludibacteraceae bacterium]|nr:hypothetical protein [Paludibacteraceae bacterium]
MGVIRYGCRFLTGLVSFILLSVSGASAQWGPGGGGGGTTPSCLLSSTEFETGIPLCDPQLSNDEDGWFNEDGDPLKAAMKDCDNTMTQPYNVAMDGMAVDVTSPSKLFDSKTWDTYLGSQGTAGQVGMTAVFANPKLIDPILSEGNGTNMLVNSGTYHDNQYFLAYSLSGLDPNSLVVMTLDSYYLIDEKSYLTYFDLNPSAANSNKASEKKTFGGALQYNQGKVQYNLTPAAGIKYTYNTTDMNQSTTLNIKATSGAQPQRLEGRADPGGNITFYIGRINPSTVPIGIDNIKVYGTIKPEIVSGGVPCPEMPSNINLKNKYPVGTEYSWKESKTGKTATTPSFTFLPPSEGEYTFSCSVKLPFQGCASEPAGEYTLKVGKCCESDEGVPMSKVNIYKNDFGKIAGKSYTYTDKSGNIREVKMTDEGYCGVTGSTPYSTIADQLGGFTGLSFNSAPCHLPGGYALMTNDPYTHKISDQEDPGTGAFMMVDLKEKNFKNPIFEQKIPGLCVKRTLYFQTDIASANNKVDDNIHLTVSISTSTGKVIKSWPHNLGKDNRWVSDTASFEVSEKSDLILRIETSDTQFPDDYGDFALDNIMLQVCAPPSIDINDTVLGKVVREKDSMLLNMCTGDTLILSTHTYEALRNFYGPSMKFMYQYTYHDPDKVSKPKWITMKDDSGNEILSDSVFVIKDPAKHEAFSEVASGGKDAVFFRLVIGKEDVLKDTSELNVGVQSPCRNVSISNLVVKASLNCAKCTPPDKVKLVADHSSFDKDKMTVELCKGESTTLSMTNKVHGIDQDNKDYYTYVATWKKDGKIISGMSKKISQQDAMAPDVSVDWDDVAAAGSAKYTLVIHDAYDATLSETQCDTTVTITVIAHPDPEAPTIDDIDLCEKVKPRKELKDRLKENDFSDFTVNWYDGANTQTASKVSEPDLDALTATSTFYYSVTDKNTLCEGKTKSFEVEVHSTSNPIGTREVSYLVKDTTASGVFKDLVTQDATVLDIESGYTYEWFDKNMHSLGNSAPTPDVPPLPLTEDEHVIYYVARKDNQYGCWSDTLDVKVTIFGVPAPNPDDVYYCVGSTRVVPLTATINTSGAATGVTFELVWYDPSKTLIGATAPTPSVAAEGETIYYVSQKSSDGAESSLQPLHVKVYKAHTLSPIAEDTYCDDNQNPSALVKFAEVGPNEFERATDIQWTLNGDPWDSDKLPILGVKKDTTYVFKAVQSYTVTDNMGTELETCYSDT